MFHSVHCLQPDSLVWIAQYHHQPLCAYVPHISLWSTEQEFKTWCLHLHDFLWPTDCSCSRQQLSSITQEDENTKNGDQQFTVGGTHSVWWNRRVWRWLEELLEVLQVELLMDCFQPSISGSQRTHNISTTWAMKKIGNRKDPTPPWFIQNVNSKLIFKKMYSFWIILSVSTHVNFEFLVSQFIKDLLQSHLSAWKLSRDCHKSIYFCARRGNSCGATAAARLPGKPSNHLYPSAYLPCTHPPHNRSAPTPLQQPENPHFLKGK